MRNKLGTICMVLGAVLILGALSLFLYNQREAAAAEQASANVLPQLLEQIEQRQQEQAAAPDYSPDGKAFLPGTPLELVDPSAFEMTEVEIDGYGYIGYLTIPSLGLELPVMGEWDYARLTIAPCRYAGSANRNNLIICGHNYPSHFGNLKYLQEGDAATFTDMDGNVFTYKMVERETLQPTDFEKMESGDWDLTLFTCAVGGGTRVTVRFEREGD